MMSRSCARRLVPATRSSLPIQPVVCAPVVLHVKAPTATRNRLFSTTRCARSSYSSEELIILPQRKLLRISGPDNFNFLHGLVTNSVNLKENVHDDDDGGEAEDLTPGGANPGIAPGGLQYTMLLNAQGRVLCDSFIYHNTDDNALLLECDASIEDKILRHLTKFRLRSDVDIEATDLNVGVVLSIDATSPTGKIAGGLDPRFPNGVGNLPGISRFALSQGAEASSSDPMEYENFRILNGIGEGSTDHPYGECFPFECNLDFLHGVDFAKGCYLGQELTARTHFTGVTRKRVMPVTFISSNPNDNAPSSQETPVGIITSTKRSAGKLRSQIKIKDEDGLHDTAALAMIRLGHVIKEDDLFLDSDGSQIHVTVPSWWPSTWKPT